MESSPAGSADRPEANVSPPRPSTRSRFGDEDLPEVPPSGMPCDLQPAPVQNGPGTPNVIVHARAAAEIPPETDAPIIVDPAAGHTLMPPRPKTADVFEHAFTNRHLTCQDLIDSGGSLPPEWRKHFERDPKRYAHDALAEWLYDQSIQSIVYRAARGVLPETCRSREEDNVVGLACIQFLAKVMDGEIVDNPINLLRVIAKKRAMDASRKKESRQPFSPLVDDPGDPERRDDGFDRERLCTAVDRLPRKYKEVVDGLFFRDMAYAQVAATLGISIRTVKRLRSEALELLREWLRD
jgi:RNA polymerase sigma factor (sigma-70 family)